MFRTLRADEIELRVGTCNEKGFSLLLYKDARCDMNILDETVGMLNWKREHSRDNANCTVSIWDGEKNEWVSKEDTGTESFTEKEKGLASDSFKRACVNWGIGRELYTAPFIWISGHTKEWNGKYKTDNYDRKLKLTDIEYDENRNINRLVIKDDSNRAVFTLGDHSEIVPEVSRPELTQRIGELLDEKKLNAADIYKKVGVNNLSEIATDRLPGMISWLEGM